MRWCGGERVWACGGGVMLRRVLLSWVGGGLELQGGGQRREVARNGAGIVLAWLRLAADLVAPLRRHHRPHLHPDVFSVFVVMLAPVHS